MARERQITGGSNKSSLAFLDLAVIWIVSVSLASVALLASGFFSSTRAIICGSAIVVLSCIAFKLRVNLRDSGLSRWLWLILLLALTLRLEPYQWIMGWQDPGIYVNMAAYYERHGSAFIK